MDSSYRQIIHRILKEERMAENSIARLLEWYRTWNDKLSQSIINGDYTKTLDVHFKSGLYLLSALKNVTKNSPELKETLKEELETVRSKMISLNQAKKIIDSTK